MFNYTALINNIKRSEQAYQVYCKNKNYHNALHIFHANEIVYDELNSLLKAQTLNNELLKETFFYLFHLEDWFLQFSILEKTVNNPEQDFSFLALKDSIPYPSHFLELVNK